MAQCPIEDCENFFEGNNDENAKSKKKWMLMTSSETINPPLFF